MNRYTRGLQGIGVLLVFFIISLMFSNRAAAQTETGTVLGTVTDTSGAVIPSAQVVLSNQDTGRKQAVSTDASGAYSFTHVLPGNFSLTVSAKGFESEQRGFALTVGEQQDFAIQLKPGSVQTIIHVAPQAPGAQVQTSTQTLSQVVTPHEMANLPSMTQDPYDFVEVMPNVTSAPAGRGVGYSINGQRAEGTNIMLDGTNNNDFFDAAVGIDVPLDAVSEYSVVSSTSTAQYGGTSGGVVNVVTKSGTNHLHGEAYEFNRVSALASNGYQNDAEGLPKQKFTRNQFGYAIGGPIWRNKLFFFDASEWIRVRGNGTLIRLVPTPQLVVAAAPATQQFFAKYGKLSTPINGLIYTKSELGSLCSATGPCASLPSDFPVFGQTKIVLPLNNGGGFPQNTYQSDARVDYDLSDRTTFYARDALESIDEFPGSNSISPYTGYTTGENWVNNDFLISGTHQFTPRLALQAKVAYLRYNSQQPYGSAGANLPTLYMRGAATTEEGYDVVMPGYLPAAPGGQMPFGGPQNTIMAYGDLSWQKGSHLFRAGGELDYLQDNLTFGVYEDANEQLGTSVPTAMDDFLNGDLHLFEAAVNPQGKYPGETITLPVGEPNFGRSDRYRNGAAYAQDSWIVRHDLTLNLGLRWEYYGVQHNVNPNLDSNFYYGSGSSIYEQIADGQVMTAPQSPIGGLWSRNPYNFSPHLGFAWDIYGNGTTSLRGGYARNYGWNYGNVTFNVLENPPAYAVLSLTAGVQVPTIPIYTNNTGPLAGNAGVSVALPTTALRTVDPHIPTEYSDQWDLGVDQKIARNTVFTLTYTGSAGRNLYTLVDVNRPGSGVVYLGLPGTTTRLNSQYSTIGLRGANGSSLYNAMIAGVRSSNLFNQLELNASVTWGHAIDDFSETYNGVANDENGLEGYLDPSNIGLDRGDADFDERLRGAISAIWTPYRTGAGSIAGRLLGGWSLSPIVNLDSGDPFSIWDCSHANTVCPRMLEVAPIASSGNHHPAPIAGEVDEFDYIDLSSEMPGKGSYINAATHMSDWGPFPANMTHRDAFHAPGSWNVNAALSKQFPVWREYQLVVRGEAYNIDNHATLYAREGEADISSYNEIRAYYSGSRQLQLAMKFIF